MQQVLILALKYCIHPVCMCIDTDGSNPATSSDNGLDGGAIAGIVIAAVIVLLIIIVIICGLFYWRHKKINNNKSKNYNDNDCTYT